MSKKLNRLNFRKLKNRDKETLRQWFNDYADSLYTIIYYRVGKDSQLASDIVQQTFLIALSKIGEYQPKKASMITWLSLLAKNYTKKLLHEKNKDLSYNCDDYKPDGRLLDAFEKLTTMPLPQDLIEQSETQQLVQTALAQISGRYRNILIQYYFEQKPVNQIASSEGLTAAASRILLHRAKKAFKNQLLKSTKSIDDFSLD